MLKGSRLLYPPKTLFFIAVQVPDDLFPQWDYWSAEQ